MNHSFCLQTLRTKRNKIHPLLNPCNPLFSDLFLWRLLEKRNKQMKNKFEWRWFSAECREVNWVIFSWNCNLERQKHSRWFHQNTFNKRQLIGTVSCWKRQNHQLTARTHTHWKSYFCCHLVAEIFLPRRCPHCIIENDITVEWGHTVLGIRCEGLNIKSKMFHRLSAWLMLTRAGKPGRRSLTDKDDQYCDSQHPTQAF